MWARLALVLLNVSLVKSDIVYLKTTVPIRTKRSVDEENNLEIRLEHKNADFAILLRRNDMLVMTNTIVEWHFVNGTKTSSKFGKAAGPAARDHAQNCFYIGEVLNIPLYFAVLRDASFFAFMMKFHIRSLQVVVEKRGLLQHLTPAQVRRSNPTKRLEVKSIEATCRSGLTDMLFSLCHGKI